MFVGSGTVPLRMPGGGSLIWYLCGLHMATPCLVGGRWHLRNIMAYYRYALVRFPYRIRIPRNMGSTWLLCGIHMRQYIASMWYPYGFAIWCCHMVPT